MATREATATEFDEMLESRGVTRRTFLKFCGAMAAMLGLSQAAVPRIANAVESGVIGKTSGTLAPVIWLELASCSGCTESLAQVTTPDVATIVLELLSLNYSETLSAAAGKSMEQAKKDTIEAYPGQYILVIEGAVMTGWDGNALRVADEKGTDIVAECAANAAAVLAVGSCAVDGGWQAAKPNPGGAEGVMKFLKDQGIATPVINLPTCPVNPEWIVAVVIDYLLMGSDGNPGLPEMDSKGMPTLIFGESVHDNCPRRGHFENGEFVYKFGSVEEKKEYCLYPMGCKGPQTYTNCPVVRWNDKVSWCVESGAPCAGCGNADPLVAGRNWVDINAPFLKRNRVLQIGGKGVLPSKIATTVAGIIAVCLVAHGFGMKAAGRAPKGAEFEQVRDWDRKHPDKAVYPMSIKMMNDRAAKAAKDASATEEKDSKGGDK